MFLAGAMACLLTSATCHLLSCCSYQVHPQFSKTPHHVVVLLLPYRKPRKQVPSKLSSSCPSLLPAGRAGALCAALSAQDRQGRQGLGLVPAQVSQLIWRFDYVGIAVLTVASFYPPCYYGFMCRPAAQLFYLLSTTLLGALPAFRCGVVFRV